VNAASGAPAEDEENAMQFAAWDIDGATVYDREGEKIGVVEDLYVDEDTDNAAWLMVDTGPFSKVKLVPAWGIRRVEDGFQVPFGRQAVAGAPSVPLHEDELNEDLERQLTIHYGIATAGFEFSGDGTELRPRAQPPLGDGPDEGSSAAGESRRDGEAAQDNPGDAEAGATCGLDLQCEEKDEASGGRPGRGREHGGEERVA
jgi:hypothetical protein